MTRQDRCAFYITLLILLSQTHYHNPRVFHHKEPTPVAISSAILPIYIRRERLRSEAPYTANIIFIHANRNLISIHTNSRSNHAHSHDRCGCYIYQHTHYLIYDFLFGYKDNASLLRYTALFILLVTKPLIFQSVHVVR